MTTGFKAALIGNRCTSPDGSMVHDSTEKIVTLAEYFAKSETARLRDALHEARQVLVTACGETAPYIKIALARIDAALNPEQ